MAVVGGWSQAAVRVHPGRFQRAGQTMAPHTTSPRCRSCIIERILIFPFPRPSPPAHQMPTPGDVGTRGHS